MPANEAEGHGEQMQPGRRSIRKIHEESSSSQAQRCNVPSGVASETYKFPTYLGKTSGEICRWWLRVTVVSS